MTQEPDFTDQLSSYMEKNGMESETLWRIGVQAEQQKLKVAAVRQSLYELEHARLDLSNAVIPFLPEAAPVALQGGPVPYAEDPYENPRFMQSDLPPHEVGRHRE